MNDLFASIEEPEPPKEKKKHSKQVTEKLFKESLKQYGEDMWVLRIQNLTHVATPGDFIVLSPVKRYLVECKQVTNSDYFAFSRLTQFRDLSHFDNIHDDNTSLIFLVFWYGRKDKSSAFLIPISFFTQLVENGYKSIKLAELKKFVEPLKISPEGWYLPL